MELSPVVSPNGAWQLQSDGEAPRKWWYFYRMKPPVWPLCEYINKDWGPRTHLHTDACKSRPHIWASLIKCCVWWWKLGCDERVWGVQRCSVNASEHRISPALLIRVRQGRIKGRHLCLLGLILLCTLGVCAFIQVLYLNTILSYYFCFGKHLLHYNNRGEQQYIYIESSSRDEEKICEFWTFLLSCFSSFPWIISWPTFLCWEQLDWTSCRSTWISYNDKMLLLVLHYFPCLIMFV